MTEVIHEIAITMLLRGPEWGRDRTRDPPRVNSQIEPNAIMLGVFDLGFVARGIRCLYLYTELSRRSAGYNGIGKRPYMMMIITSERKSIVDWIASSPETC